MFFFFNKNVMRVFDMFFGDDVMVMKRVLSLFLVMFGNLDELDDRSFRISASSAVYYNLDIERGISIHHLNDYIRSLEAEPEKYQTQFDVSGSLLPLIPALFFINPLICFSLFCVVAFNHAISRQKHFILCIPEHLLRNDRNLRFL